MNTTQGKPNANAMYDKLDETQNFPVADGFVSFTRIFRYLGLLISYNLRDDDDITSQLAAANASMARLKEVWRNPQLDVYNKYLLFCAIPMNLLLWGAETWLLRKSQLDKLEVFLHRSIRRILQISMTKVREQRLHNDKVRQMFYSILCVRNMIAARQMDFIGKMICGPPDRPSRKMITACCDHKQRVGRPQTTGINFMVENLRLLFREIPTVQIDQYGSLRNWITKLQTRNTGANWSSASFTPPHHFQIALMTGAPSHLGKHDALLLDTNRPTIPTIATMTHLKLTQEVTSTSPHNPPHPIRATPPHHHTTHLPPGIQQMMTYTIQNAGSMTLPSAPWSGAACHTP